MASETTPMSSSPHIIPFLTCRKCSGGYTYALPDSQIVTIFCGQGPKTPYKALSYVCGTPSPNIYSSCRTCLITQPVSITGIRRFIDMMDFIGGGNSVFLDILSINQESAEGLMSELLVMGNTYRHASTISVFLPTEDGAAYWVLKDLAQAARNIVAQQHGFGFPYGVEPVESDAHEDMNLLAASYLSLVEQWSDNIKKWKYWKRAWTFQEWAVAAEIEVTFEGASPDERIVDIKNDISSACTIVCHYQMQIAKEKDAISGLPRAIGDFYIPLTKSPGNLPELHATLVQKEEDFLATTDLNTPMPCLKSQMEERERTGQVLNTICSLFPFQDFLVADSEEDFDVQRQNTYLTSSIDSGTYVTLPSLQKSDPGMIALRSSLALALNALGTSQREASFEADLVVCWASMCGIGYTYDKADIFAVALHKAVSEMRNQGLRVFNWLASAREGETDIKFLDYAPSQRQCNAASKGVLFGSPVFVGRVDTCFHLKHALEQDDALVLLEKKCEVTLRKVKSSGIVTAVPATITNEVFDVFQTIVTGEPDGSQITDVLLNIKETINSIPLSKLATKLLVTASVEVEDNGTKYEIDTWAIVPCALEFAGAFVARESLNGTLVVAISTETQTQIVAYLTMTHQKYGTYLLKSDESGIVDVVFKKEEKTALFDDSDLWQLNEEMSKLLGGESWGSLGNVLDRALNVSIALDDHSILVA